MAGYIKFDGIDSDAVQVARGKAVIEPENIPTDGNEGTPEGWVFNPDTGMEHPNDRDDGSSEEASVDGIPEGWVFSPKTGMLHPDVIDAGTPQEGSTDGTPEGWVFDPDTGMEHPDTYAPIAQEAEFVFVADPSTDADGAFEAVLQVELEAAQAANAAPDVPEGWVFDEDTGMEVPDTYEPYDPSEAAEAAGVIVMTDVLVTS